MKKILFGTLTAVVAIGIAVPVALGATKPVPLAPTTPSSITCFDGKSEGTVYGGKCTVNRFGVATLNNSSGDVDGEYSGVYVKNSNLVGKAIGTISQLGFSYAGDVATPGAPRISLPLDINGNGTSDGHAFISPFYCSDGAGNVDVINDPTCTIHGDFGVYANWAEMVEAHPDAKVSSTPFVIADERGTWTVSNVKLGTSVILGLKK